MTNEQRVLISKIFHCRPETVQDVCVLGSMTNDNEIFSILGVEYVLRQPGKGANELVNRTNELSTYYHIRDLRISDDPIYFDSATGIKITKYIANARTCNPRDQYDCAIGMKMLKHMHDASVVVPHKIDMQKMILKYESLMKKSKYADYMHIRNSIMFDLAYLESTKTKECLTHFDPNPDNMLFTRSSVYLLDWEYAGMHDPLVDIAMFAIYSDFSKEQIIELAHLYDDNISDSDIQRIFTYCACAGFLWSNWCEYKYRLGVDFGDYATRQYEYAKEFTGAWKWKQ